MKLFIPYSIFIFNHAESNLDFRYYVIPAKAGMKIRTIVDFTITQS